MRRTLQPQWRDRTSDFALELILISIFGDDYESKLLSQGENPFAFLASDSTRDLSVVMKARNLRRLLLEIIEARRVAGNVETYDFLSMYMVRIKGTSLCQTTRGKSAPIS